MIQPIPHFYCVTFLNIDLYIYKFTYIYLLIFFPHKLYFHAFHSKVLLLMENAHGKYAGVRRRKSR